MAEKQWIRTADVNPDTGLVVETKLDDEKGVRNVQRLRKIGNLWYTPDRTMYVYYTPTHWREV